MNTDSRDFQDVEPAFVSEPAGTIDTSPSVLSGAPDNAAAGYTTGPVQAVVFEEDDTITVEHDTSDADADLEAQRRQVEMTRSELGSTLNAIQEKLSPANLAQEAKSAVQDATVGKATDAVAAATDTVQQAVSSAADTVQQITSAPSTLGSMLVETIRENPLPAALAGVGLGWLIVRLRDRASQTTPDTGTYPRRGYYGPRQYDTDTYGRYDTTGAYGSYRSGVPGYGYTEAYGAGYSDRYQQPGSYGSSGQTGMGNAVNTAQGAAQNAADTVGQVANQVQGGVQNVAAQAQDVASQVGDTAGQVVDQAQYGAQQAVGGLQQMIEERPLAVAAVALGIGAAIGLALPETQQENEWMGDARQNLMDTAQQKAQETVQKVQTVAGDAMDAAQQSAQEQGLTQ